MDVDTNTPNLEQLMQFGIQSARQGNKQNARVIFQQILDSDKQNERAWLWMAAVAESPEDRVRFLNTVLQINPQNTAARKELDKLQKKRVSSNTVVLRYGLITIGIILVLVVCVFAVLLAIG